MHASVLASITKMEGRRSTKCHSTHALLLRREYSLGSNNTVVSLVLLLHYIDSEFHDCGTQKRWPDFLVVALVQINAALALLLVGSTMISFSKLDSML
jgi:hypothetical protein